uniref:PGG domain-containing protein n=1 Tax=Oryza rufipogon TaxID=4529 RepID=A0A0E0R6F8_ORYRU
MENRPWLAKQQNEYMRAPIHYAALWGMGTSYQTITPPLDPLLVSAGIRGHIGIAQEILIHCPDAPYCTKTGWTCLHGAVSADQVEYVKFILSTPQLRKLTGMRDSHGKTALRVAVHKGNPKMNEVSLLMLEADPQDASFMHNVHMEAKEKVTNKSRKDVKALTERYTSNTSLVAILIATITFAAAFTLPGGYSAVEIMVTPYLHGGYIPAGYTVPNIDRISL